MTAAEEARRRAERARRVALFRYELIQEVIDPSLSTRQRGPLVRRIADREHEGPFGEKVRVSRGTIDRWCRWWRGGGFEALVPTPARVQPRTPAEVLAVAVALKRENPDRTATQVVRILRAQSGWSPSERTLQRHFVALELDREVPAAPSAFGRFQADRPNELWVGDALHGPVVGGRRTFLFAFLDDRSRAVMAARFGYHEDTIRLAAALRPALASRGVPESIYVDYVARNIIDVLCPAALCGSVTASGRDFGGDRWFVRAAGLITFTVRRASSAGFRRSSRLG